MQELPAQYDAADTGESHERSRSQAALLLGVANSLPHKYTRNGLVLDATAAFQSHPLVENLLKLGIFSMNIPTMSGLEEAAHRAGVNFAAVPSALIATGIHYAISVAPRQKGFEGDEAPVICLDALAAHVAKIERELSEIHIDHGLVSSVRMAAQKRLEAGGAPQASGPEGRA